MTSTETLILDLSTDLAPVRQRNSWIEAGALLGIGAAEAALIAMTGTMRPDLGQIILSPFMAWKIGGLAALAALCCTVAVRSFSPPGVSRIVMSMASSPGLAQIQSGISALVKRFTRQCGDRWKPSPSSAANQTKS